MLPTVVSIYNLPNNQFFFTKRFKIVFIYQHLGRNSEGLLCGSGRSARESQGPCREGHGHGHGHEVRSQGHDHGHEVRRQGHGHGHGHGHEVRRQGHGHRQEVRRHGHGHGHRHEVKRH